MINLNRCYMDELCKYNEFKADKFVNARDADNRKMNGDEKYLDPDAKSLKLYDDFKAVYHHVPLPNGEYFNLEEIKEIRSPNGDTYYVFRSGDIRYSTDYLGPSATQAYYRGVPNGVVGVTIKRCRVFGGHILWPCHQNSVNQAKGGVFDRMDITLAEIKDYYENKSFKAKYNQRVRNAIIRDSWYFDKFVNFEGFCNFFSLVGSFVDENYNIVWFCKELSKFNIGYEEMMALIEENTSAIIKRNMTIDNALRKNKGLK